MPTLSPNTRRALAFAGLTGALAAPATIAAAAQTSGSAALSPVSLTAPADSLDVVATHLQAHLAETRHDTVVRRTLRTARHAATLRGSHLPHGYRTVLDRRTNAALKAKRRHLLREIRTLRSTAGAPAIAIPAQLAAIAACESGGNPQAIGGGGAFRGKYQFDYGTWASVGGSGDPAAAPEAEQDRRAAMLYARSGATPWPVCGR
ncbi:transglycosylase family protein [Paraconexibacter antarcticus]|uniref:Transglycosylase family protein n=1 Tax=Paraconexibacter antarcticus TaxID=2949664 RepID=A0ABY5DNU2_9ACTN|nr:transglycosylase family protein [Paraconexibacter antarcticus]UTI62289.1 transglycosylase family protein [Paraconexibacter antarcticus]